jgi:NADP-dependent aldehyde dehydrogenase
MLVPLAAEETRLAPDRLVDEIAMTRVLAYQVAQAVERGDYLSAAWDLPDEGYPLGARPDVRRFLLPRGVALNFAASNFPFLFSVFGVDTIAALGAGCSVIVKTHPGHLGLSRRVAEIVGAAFVEAGLPADALGLVEGDEIGVDVLRHPHTAVATFTGSLKVGRLLADIAAARPVPIPFFGELGSVNPVVVSPAAMAARGADILAGFAGLTAWSNGQVCTRPGFLFIPRGSAALMPLIDVAAPAPMLHPGVLAKYRARLGVLAGAPAVTTIGSAVGVVDVDGDVGIDGTGAVAPSFFLTDVAGLAAQPELFEETFGPAGVVVQYDRLDDVEDFLGTHLAGALTAAVHSEPGVDDAALVSLVGLLQERVGRIIFDGWTTDLPLSDAVLHGGPYPASTNDSGSAVGGIALQKFLRPVAYQNAPQHVLPADLRDGSTAPARRGEPGEFRMPD